MFSSLINHLDQPLNTLYETKKEFVANGEQFIDLVSGNVTEHGILFPPDLLSAAFERGFARTAVYRPDPMGHFETRSSLSQWYAAQQVNLPAEQILLTPGTSLAYWYAFRLLAQAGDEILCPAPNYPLFDSIAAAADIRLRSYPLVEKKGWSVDLGGLAAAITTKTRAIVLVSPHNPTGHVLSQAELDGIASLARQHDIALIFDEVFSPFLFEQRSLPRPVGGAAPLVITLNGFSKMLALPGVKFGWMALSGDADRVGTALRILDSLSDMFLPVAEATQAAAPMLLEKSGDFQANYRREIQNRASGMQKALAAAGLEARPSAAGFYTVLSLKEGQDEEALAVQLLKDEGVLVHPGYFYEMAGAHWIVSHVGTEEFSRAAMEKIRRVIGSEFR
jgi:alanine-synthesizing transaminase